MKSVISWSARREASCPADGHKAILLSSRRTRFTSSGKAIARMSCHGHLPKSYCPSFYEILATIATNLHKEKSKRASHYVDITSMQSQLLHSEINVCSYPVSQIKKQDTLLLSITCPNIEIFKILSPSDSVVNVIKQSLRIPPSSTASLHYRVKMSGNYRQCETKF